MNKAYKGINEFTPRPWAHFGKDYKNKLESRPVPFKAKPLPKIGTFTMTIPLPNGKFAYLVIPNNYSAYDGKIILAQLEVVKMSLGKK